MEDVPAILQAEERGAEAALVHPKCGPFPYGPSPGSSHRGEETARGACAPWLCPGGGAQLAR